MGKVKTVTNKPTQSKPGLLFWLGVMLAVAYFNGSKAVDTGSWLYYFGALASLIAVMFTVKQLLFSFKYVKK